MQTKRPRILLAGPFLLGNSIKEDGIPWIYAKKIRSQRTRSFELDVPERENKPEILHTLLGIELKVGKKRISCPDLATARYLSVFARSGCRNIAIPYDITKISNLADELERAWYKMLLLLEEIAKSKTPQVRGKMRSALMKQVRLEIEGIGAGETMPEFNRIDDAKRTLN